jgi:hypothetical protein
MPNTIFGFVATRIAANLDQTCRNKNNSDNRYRVLEKCFTSALVRLTLFTFSNKKKALFVFSFVIINS